MLIKWSQQNDIEAGGTAVEEGVTVAGDNAVDVGVTVAGTML